MLHGITLEPLPSARASRRDGQQARTRLLQAAVRLFADKGFAKASTREIAQAAGVNIAAISYYFGDKAGLYRAALADAQPADVHAPAAELSLREALEAHFGDSLRALQLDDHALRRARLRLRQALEPSEAASGAPGDADETLVTHRDLVHRIGRHLKLPDSDVDLNLLAWAIAGLALPFLVHHDAVRQASPTLFVRAEAVEAIALRLADHAMGMIDTERERRAMKQRDSSHRANTASVTRAAGRSPRLRAATAGART